jgi:DDE domain
LKYSPPIRRHGVPERITSDGSAVNEAAIKRYNKEHGTAIEIRQIKYLNNLVEQDHRGVKRITRPMLGFKSFDAAQATLVGVELMRMIKTGRPVLHPGCVISSRARATASSAPSYIEFVTEPRQVSPRL